MPFTPSEIFHASMTKLGLHQTPFGRQFLQVLEEYGSFVDNIPMISQNFGSVPTNVIINEVMEKDNITRVEELLKDKTILVNEFYEYDNKFPINMCKSIPMVNLLIENGLNFRECRMDEMCPLMCVPFNVFVYLVEQHSVPLIWYYKSISHEKSGSYAQTEKAVYYNTTINSRCDEFCTMFQSRFSMLPNEMLPIIY